MILVFDCSISGFSIGVFDKSEKLLKEIFDPTPFGHTEQLVPKIQSLLLDAGVSFNQLTQIITTKGPGSFTGIRVGLATASGLSAALNIPVITVNTLLALATTPCNYDTRHVILDTKCGDVYYQSFIDPGNAPLKELSPPSAIPISDIPNHSQTDACITHTTMQALLQNLSTQIITTELTPQHVLNAAKIEPTHDLSPLYIRSVNATPTTS